MDTHPHIYDVGEEVIVNWFFNNLKPSHLASQLLFLKIKTIADASNALKDFYVRKDLVLEEISLDKESFGEYNLYYKTDNDSYKNNEYKDNYDNKI